MKIKRGNHETHNGLHSAEDELLDQAIPNFFEPMPSAWLAISKVGLIVIRLAPLVL